MKKIIAIVLIIALIMPATALAVDGNSPFYGKWVGQKHGSTANYDAILYFMEITKYTTCEYFVLYLHMGGGWGQAKISDQDIYSDHWEIVDDHLKIPTSGISYIEVYYDEETDMLYTKEWPEIEFVRIP